ncbi:Uncharacterized protein APZ42_026970 [Daphnia magna]|uniref:Uncharacterized protein n=1 Tax=Daphnia magna TaxID=35525 RepID=A0A162DA12_9CRUS|nr:Uncharacterized protein APZ42_026970 [Daphnia magna]
MIFSWNTCVDRLAIGGRLKISKKKVAKLFLFCRIWKCFLKVQGLTRKTVGKHLPDESFRRKGQRAQKKKKERTGKKRESFFGPFRMHANVGVRGVAPLPRLSFER